MSNLKKKINRAAKHQRKWFGKWHTWAGISAGFVIIIVALTGALLSFERELDALIYPELFDFKKEENYLSFQQVTEQVRQDHPKWDMHGVFKTKQVYNHAYMIHLHGDTHEQVIINPYTGIMTGKRVYAKTVMGVIRKLHRTLLIPVVGKYIVGLSSLVCVILIITGLRLWIPRQWSKVSGRLSVKWSSTKKRVNNDLHRTLGLYFSPVIVLIALTGVMITFNSIMLLFSFLLSFEPPQSIASIFDQKSTYVEGKKPLEIDQIVEYAEAFLPKGKVMGVSFPHDSSGVYNINVLTPTTSKVGDRSVLFIDQYSGEVISSSEDEQYKIIKAYLNWTTPIHYGTFGGLPTRILALVSALVTAVLFITGLFIWMPRWRKAKRIAKEKSTRRVLANKKTHLETESIS